jgi:RNA polymerase-binding transcription factor DksA
MIRQDLVSDIRKKLEAQKESCIARLDELEKSDPFNLDQTRDVDDDRTSPDDEAQLNEQHERIASQMEAQKKMIVRIDGAMGRIADGTYGVCEICGKDIEVSFACNAFSFFVFTG